MGSRNARGLSNDIEISEPVQRDRSGRRMKSLRQYQREACDAFYSLIHDGGMEGTIELATGLGKSLVVATICQEVIDAYPDTRILSTVHTRELIRQTAEEMLELWPCAPIGINSAGLHRRDWGAQITFGGIQSIYNSARDLGKHDLVIIDEAHLISPARDSRYQQLLTDLREMKPTLRVLKLTATPFRLDNGKFHDIIYSYGIAQGVGDGWLVPPITKAMVSEIDTSNVHVRSGEFVNAELEAAALPQVREAVAEMVEYGRDRRAWIVFCVSVKHAGEVHKELRRHGINSAVVTGKTPTDERDATIKAYSRGEIKCLVNVGVLTTGFNVRFIDMIALMRPTMSPGLAIQQIGRGTRSVIADLPDTIEERLEAIALSDKPDCLILDFGRILKTHGPIDRMAPPERKKRARGDNYMVPIRICPNCNAIMPVQARKCDACGEEFPREERQVNHDGHADGESAILSTQAEAAPPRWLDVKGWRVSVGRKGEDSPEYLRVAYLCGLSKVINEFLCFDHPGRAPRAAARRWVDLTDRKEQFTPQNTKEALERAGELRMPSRIQITKEGRYYKVMKSERVTEDVKQAA